MKKIIIILSLLINFGTAAAQEDFVYPKAADYPKISSAENKIEDFVPKGFSVVDKEIGDLNGDKLPDAVLIIKGNSPRFLNKNKNLGTDIFDTNPRILIIIFKNGDNFKLFEQNNSFIIPPDSPTMSEPFQKAEIKNGVLELNFEEWYSAGSWGASQFSYKFRFQNGQFELIGADKTESRRNTGETETRSYNFLTKKVKITTGNFTGSVKDKTRWKIIKLNQLKTFETFKKPFEWEIERDYFL